MLAPELPAISRSVRADGIGQRRARLDAGSVLSQPSSNRTKEPCLQRQPVSWSCDKCSERIARSATNPGSKLVRHRRRELKTDFAEPSPRFYSDETASRETSGLSIPSSARW